MVGVGQEWEMFYPECAPLRFWLRREKRRYVMRCFDPELRTELCRGVLDTPTLVDPGHPALVGFMSKFIRKSLERRQILNGRAHATDTEFSKAYPALAEFVTLSVDDGKPRKTATINVFFQDGVFKAFLNDRESGASLCALSPTFAGLWQALEEAVTADSPAWRHQQGDGSMSRRKRP